MTVIDSNKTDADGDRSTMTQMHQARDGVKKPATDEHRVVIDTDACDLEAELTRVQDDMDAFGDVKLYRHVDGEKIGAFVVDGDELPGDARLSDLREKLEEARED